MPGFQDYPNDKRWAQHPQPSAAVHPSCYIETPCQIGANTAVFPFSHIMAHAIIGDHCHIGHHVTIGSGVVIGHNVKVMNNALLNSGVILQDDVYCGPSTVFAPIQRIRSTPEETISRISPTLVRKGASIGPNTTIAAGLTIGRHTFIEAGSVIDSNVPDFALAYGNPLRLIGWRCECGAKLAFDDATTVCTQCGHPYERRSAQKIVAIDGPLTLKDVSGDSDSRPDPTVRRTQAAD